MREIPKKNYFILVLLLIFTVLITLLLSSLYTNKDKSVSSFYEYCNIIKPEEFDQFMTENFDAIIYISDKYDLSFSSFENKFKDKIDQFNIKNNLIYIDKADINKNFLEKLKDNYDISINLDKTPIIIVIVDNKVVNNIIVNKNLDVDKMIEYGVFEWLI